MAEYAILTECEKTPDGYFRHTKCGELLDTAEVRRPMWDGRFTAAGDGSVHVEQVPYCGKCEAKPSATGTPVYY